MSREANKQIVRRFIEEVINTGDVTQVDELIHAEYVEVHNNVRYPVGPQGARAHIVGVRRTYPDLHLTIEHQIAEGDWVATLITARGTHSGNWLGIKPTGKSVQFTGVNINRIIDGLIIEHGGAANMLEPLLEIGAVQVVGASSR